MVSGPKTIWPDTQDSMIKISFYLLRQLIFEMHVWIYAETLMLNVLKGLPIRHTVLLHNISDHNGRRARDSGVAMN